MPQLLVQSGPRIVESDSARVWATIDDRNPLAGGDAAVGEGRVVMWSGWRGEGTAARGVFSRDFRTWSPEAWRALEEFCDGVLGREPGAHLLLRPHARHVLSDAQSCLSFFRKREGQAIGLLLDPVAMLTPEMLAEAEEHLERIVGALGDLAATSAVVLGGAHLVGTEWGDEVVTAAPGAGAVVERLECLYGERVPEDRLRVVWGGGGGGGAELPGRL